MKLTRFIQKGLAIGLVCGLPCAGRAQNALGNGHALDANNQVGSGGYNTAQNKIDYAARNNVITGNVPGLGYFHGKVPYTAPGEFGGTFNDPLFRFDAISYPQSPTAEPYVRQGAPLPVFSSEAPTLAGQLGQLSPTNPVLLPNQAAPGAWSLGVITPKWSALGGYARPVPELGSVEQVNGHALSVDFSPLLGVRYEQINDLPGTYRDTTLLTYRKRGATPGALEVNNPPTRPISGENGQLDNGMFAPSLELGLQLQDQMNSNLSPDARLSVDRRLAQIRAAMFSPLGSRSAAPGEDVYLDLLRSIASNRQIAAGMAPRGTAEQTRYNTLASPLPGSPPAGGSSGAGEVSPSNTTPSPLSESPGKLDQAAMAPLPALRAPSASQLDAARQARADALRRAQGAAQPNTPPEAPGASANAGANGQTNARESTEESGPASGALGGMVETLKYNLPPMTTMAGARATRVNDLFRGAEGYMVAGKYFDAEGDYRLILNLQPDNPLAAVGQVNAQLGAGMARSAGFNLRQVFEQHPEVISARYSSRLMPTADRLESVRAELDDMIRSSDSQEPALLLAYLGYQTRSPQLVRYGLDLAQARAPNDPLARLLRSLWLGAPTAQPASPPAPPAPPVATPANQDSASSPDGSGLENSK